MHDDTKERDQCLTLPDRGSFVGVIVSAGARNRFTRPLGAGKTEKARKVFSLACVVSVGISKDIQYTCVLKLNNILVKI